MARMSRKDKQQYAEMLGLEKSEIAHLTDRTIRQMAIGEMEPELKEFTETAHQSYTLPEELEISPGELNQLYQQLAAMERYSADSAFITRRYIDQEGKEHYRRTAIIDIDDDEYMAEAVDGLDADEYTSELGYAGGYIVTFVSGL